MSDSLLGLGPITDGAISKCYGGLGMTKKRANKEAEEGKGDDEGTPSYGEKVTELVYCCGYGRDGAIVVMSNGGVGAGGFGDEVEVSFSIPHKCDNLFTLPGLLVVSVAAGAAGGGDGRTLVLEPNEETGELLEKPGGGDEGWGDGLRRDVVTLACDVVGGQLVQLHSGGLRISDATPVDHVLGGDGSRIVGATFGKNFMAVLSKQTVVTKPMATTPGKAKAATAADGVDVEEVREEEEEGGEFEGSDEEVEEVTEVVDTVHIYHCGSGGVGLYTLQLDDGSEGGVGGDGGGGSGGGGSGGGGGGEGGASISTLAILDEASTRALYAHTHTRLASHLRHMAVARSDGSIEIHTIPEPDSDPFGGGKSPILQNRILEHNTGIAQPSTMHRLPPIVHRPPLTCHHHHHYHHHHHHRYSS